MGVGIFGDVIQVVVVELLPPLQSPQDVDVPDEPPEQSPQDVDVPDEPPEQSPQDVDVPDEPQEGSPLTQLSLNSGIATLAQPKMAMS